MYLGLLLIGYKLFPVKHGLIEKNYVKEKINILYITKTIITLSKSHLKHIINDCTSYSM